jgi:type I restriction enzyme S subunit
MNPQELLNYFDRISEAPDAIPRLRQFILDLAVRGKLVEQDPKDEPASELLKRILKLHNNPEIIDSPVHEPLFDLPSSWTWVTLEQIAHLEMGQSPPSEHYNQSKCGLPFYQGKTDFGKRYPTPRYWCTQPTKIAYKGDILISVRAPVGPTNVANEECCIGRGLSALRPYQGVELEYLLLTLKCFESDLASLGFGTTFVAVTKKQLISFRLPLSPLAEQHRIVAKVDELMALCDKLEATQKERENRLDRLVKATLSRVSTGEESIANTRFFLDNIPHITTRPEHIKKLRQTILDLAVRGKLVPQDPTDETASELLKTIDKRKAQLLDEGKIKKKKPCRQFNNEEVPYIIPNSWIWTMLGEITDVGTGSTPSRVQNSFWTDGSIPWVTSGSTSKPLIIEGDEFITIDAVKACRLRLYQPGTLLIALYGQGKTRGQVSKLAIEATINQALAAVCTFSGLETMQAYLKLLLERNYDEVRTLSAGGTQPNLNVQKIKELFVPLPPLAEQQRIVAKVDELMALCDKLETRLNNLQTENQRLLQAVLHRALS